MKKFLRILGIFLLVLIVGLGVTWFIMDEALPQGTPGPEADAMAERMLKAMNVDGWNNTDVVVWNFRDRNQYLWNRMDQFVVATIGGKDYRYNLVDGSVGPHGMQVVSNAKEAVEQMRKVPDHFNNDSFWLYAPYKLFDPGTERSIVELGDGRQGLMITYTTGGTTPGDSYLWLLDENDRPEAVKMWAAKIPLGGIEFTWEKYVTLSSGALIATEHKALGGLLNVELTGLNPLP